MQIDIKVQYLGLTLGPEKPNFLLLRERERDVKSTIRAFTFELTKGKMVRLDRFGTSKEHFPVRQ